MNWIYLIFLDSNINMDNIKFRIMSTQLAYMPALETRGPLTNEGPTS